MWQMLKWLLQWLNKFFQYLFAGHRNHQSDGLKGSEVIESLPELTNADLEVLFNELLEGVHQARGQQWALKYLQRMEPRITVERWIDWLLVFGEKLLSSSVPNSHIAMRMVQLGELNVGKVGELAYEIGIQLLNNQFLAQIDQGSPQLEVLEQEATVPIEPILDSPGQQLLREWGDQFWAYDQEEAVQIPPVILSLEELDNPNLDVDLNFEQLLDDTEAFSYEYTAPDYPSIVEEAVEEVVEEAVEDVVPSPLSENLDQSLTNLEPTVANTLDKLVVRLEQNTNLVQQLASELALREQNQAIIQQRSGFQLTVTNQAEAWFYQGLQQAKSGDLLGALAFYTQATKLQPESYEYWFNQGLTLFHLQRFEEAITAYDQAVNLKPDFSKAWYNRGGVLGECGDFDGAIASFDQAIESKPDYQAAWASRGLALLKLGLIWEAISSYDQALNLQPQDQETWYYRGVALAVGEQFEDAIASYDQALEIQPDYHEVLIDRGVVLFNLQNWSAAIESWDQALAIQPDFYLAWYNRGIALENLGKREESIHSYQQSIKIKPDFHLAWYNQAVALFNLDRLAEAISCYDSALEIKLDYWEAWLGRAWAVGNVVNKKTSLSVPSHIATSHPSLNQRGYEGKLATYQEGLKYLRPDTHPEGWGRLHLAIANTHYEQGKKQNTPRDLWKQAVSEYQQALLTLTATDFTELHLDVLQSLAKVFIGLGETRSAQEIQQQGLELLQQLLNQITRSEPSKKQLALKFAGLIQLGVDLAVDTGDLVEAWEIAEHSKNTCLTLLLSGWHDQIYAPNYETIQQLLNPTTAIIYWHISPVALQTFIIKHEAPSPLILFTPIQDVESTPEAVQRLIDFENWLEVWQKEYQEYCQNPDRENNHSWWLEMQERLLQLQRILNLSTIIQELEDIHNLIFVPHRDLNKLPIHALFSGEETTAGNYTIHYLPNIKIGLELKTNLLSNWQDQKFLSVENIEAIDNQEIKSADFAAAIVSKMFNDAQYIQGLQATKYNIENILSTDYNIFHFTGYALNNLNEVEKSALILANEEQMSLLAISQLNFSNYHLVTLPNCENVSHKNLNISGEYVDLRTGFLNRGVAYVLSTIWKIESSSTALVIIEFYRRLILHQSPVIALAEATHWLKYITVAELMIWYEDLCKNLHPEELKLRNYVRIEIDKCRQLLPQEKPYNHPYYWATFMLTGYGSMS